MPRSRKSMATNQLGVSTAMFETFDPSRHLPLLPRYGVSAVELSGNCFKLLQDEAGFAELSAAIRRANVAVNSIHVPYRSAPLGRLCSISDLDEVARNQAMDMTYICLERLIALGGRFLVVHPSIEPIPDMERQSRIELCRQNLSALASHLSGSAPVKIAVECLPRTCLGRDSRELVGIVEAVGSPAVGVCLDVNHANLREDLIQATQHYGARLLTLHISDNDGIDERHWLPLRGVIPWEEWTRALLSTGYAGPFLYEVDPWEDTDGQPLVAAALLAEIQRNAARLFTPSG